MKKILIILYVLTFIASCERDKSVKFAGNKDKYYHDYPEYYDNHLEYTLKENTRLLNSAFVINALLPDSLNFIKIQQKNKISFTPYLTMQAIEFLRDNIRDFSFYKYLIYSSIYKGFLFHIEYPIETSCRKKMMIFAFQDNSETKIMTSAYIEWISKPMNPEALKYIPEIDPAYMWGINKTTDTIKTNLSLKSIKYLYPDFEGVYIFKLYKEIIFDFNYPTFDQSFFKHIEFIE